MAYRIDDRYARFMPTNELLLNPHMGFTTFQRFNGDKLNPLKNRGWTEGYPIEYQPFTGSLKNENHPDTTLAYFRVYWKFFEPEEGQYNYDLLEKALATADSRGQKLMFRLAPYGEMEDIDVPDWYRDKYGEKHRGFNDHSIPEKDGFYRHFPDAIRAIAAKYDNDPRLDSVDLSIIGTWGEGGGTDTLPPERRRALIDAYTHSFKKTPLMGFIVSPDAVLYANRTRPVGWRADCLGDMGGFDKGFSHMLDFYPKAIEPLKDLWKKAPVSFEVCWVVYHWLDMGWDIDYIIEQSLKWHITSFNAKSSAIPPQWQSSVDEWCRRMGYRYTLRSLRWPGEVSSGDLMHVEMWMENRGVAPCYYRYPLALRLKGEHADYTILTDTDCRDWLPGDTIWHDDIRLPEGLLPGSYQLQAALVDPDTLKPVIRMPVNAPVQDGFTVIGPITVV